MYCFDCHEEVGPSEAVLHAKHRLEATGWRPLNRKAPQTFWQLVGPWLVVGSMFCAASLTGLVIWLAK